MSGLQMSIAAGLAIGLGLAAILAHLVPAYPNLAQAVQSMGPTAANTALTVERDWQERIGAWAIGRVPSKFLRVPAEDLSVLGISTAGFLGRKMVYALIGLCAPALIGTAVMVLRVPIPVTIPAVVSLALGAGMFLLPDLAAREKAAAARKEFTWALATYIDLVALGRYCGSGAKQALDEAADVGDTWVFRTLREALDQATWAGKAPWDGLRETAESLALPELSDVADIMRLTGSQGVGVYKTLRARAQSLRTAMMADELAKANEANEKMSVPVSVLGIVFLGILIGPALMGMFAA